MVHTTNVRQHLRRTHSGKVTSVIRHERELTAGKKNLGTSIERKVPRMTFKEIGNDRVVVLQRQRNQYGSGWEYAVYGRKKSGNGVIESEASYFRDSDASNSTGWERAKERVKDINSIEMFNIFFPALR